MKVPVVFMRGGSSKGLFFHERDLPPAGAERDRFILSAFGSPDPYQRQLNGMGGGVSSLSKVIIVSPSQRPGCDVEYLHGQVGVDEPSIDYSANCGNLSSAVGPFAVDEGMVKSAGDRASIRLFNRNTDVFIDAQIPLRDGCFVPTGDFVMPGVAGTGAAIALDYRDPGFGAQSLLFPSGNASDLLGPGNKISASLGAAALPTVWVNAKDLGVDPAILPRALDDNRGAMELMEALRREGAVRMGLAANTASAGFASPKIGIVGPPSDYVTLDGRTVRAGEYDISARVVSVGKTHLAIPLACGMCLAAVCLAQGAVPHQITGSLRDGKVRIGTPSGLQVLGAALAGPAGGGAIVRTTTTYASARRLMAGEVYGE